MKSIGSKLTSHLRINYLLIYDPYTASIDWNALLPFIRNWGEVILNHMVLDSIRAVGQAKRPEKISKYEQTYLAKIEDIVAFGNDRAMFEQRIQDILNALNGDRRGRYYIASYPFFNSRNSLVYNLIHCTGSKEGFKLYKSTAWTTFGGKSSTKRSKIDPNQLQIVFEPETESYSVTTQTDENCYYVQDIVDFIAEKFRGRSNVSLAEIWDAVDEHPVFPSDLYKNEIKELLKAQNCKVHRSSIDFV